MIARQAQWQDATTPMAAQARRAVGPRTRRTPVWLVTTSLAGAALTTTWTTMRRKGALAQLPRIDIEPDGFFVISGDLDGKRWQLDGHLYDFGDRLHRVELHGDCPRESLDAILSCLGWPAVPLAFELVMEGVALDEASFRQFAAALPTS